MSNTFEQLIGRQVFKIFRLDSGEDFPALSFPIGLFFMLDKTSGLTICFNFYNPTLNINYSTLEDFKYDYGIEYGETVLNDLNNDDTLLKLIGQRIKAIKIGQITKDELFGDNFIIKADEFVGIFIEFENDKLTLFSTENGGQILFNSNQTFPNSQDWTLT
jgi:hypothetical protein